MGQSSSRILSANAVSGPPKHGLLFLVAGPAGVGKTTLIKRLISEEKKLARAVSVTTRKPRVGETDGVAYHFWEEARFRQALERGEFLESARVHGHYYGTLAAFVEEKLNAGLDVIKDIDVQGAAQLRQMPRFAYPHSVGVFVMPPSREELVRRLQGRASESSQSLEERLKAADGEIARMSEFEYAVVNDVFERAYAQLKSIRIAEHCRMEQLKANGA